MEEGLLRQAGAEPQSYWASAPAVDEILFVTYQNADTMVADLRPAPRRGAGHPPGPVPERQAPAGITAIDYNYRIWDYLSFNCYDSPDSLGNPVLLDARFRQALN